MDPGTAALLIGTAVSAGTAIYGATHQPELPKAPKPPVQQVGTGPEQQAAKTIDEDTTAVVSARKTARKGAAAYRIPLQAKSTGVSTSASTSLNI